LRFLKKIAIDLLLAFIVFLLINQLFFGEFIVRGRSMTPTIFPGERILVLRFPPPKIRRCDIVVFLYPRNPRRSFIKRVAGLPGEEIEISGGKLRVNGSSLERPCFRLQPWAKLKKKIPLGFFFVLGDNSEVSNDSRYGWLVPADYIEGKALAVFWPPSRIRWLR